MRARYPDLTGFVERDGVKVAYESYGSGELTVVFPPMDAIVHMQAWKAQVPYLARYARVVNIDPRGNGRSDRPTDPNAYADLEYDADLIAVMDELEIERAVLIGACTSAWRALTAAALHPERVLGVVSISSSAPRLTPPFPERAAANEVFDEVLDSHEGWFKENRHFWLDSWPDYARFFFSTVIPEPHSSKQIEDAVGWALDVGPETMLIAEDAPRVSDTPEDTAALLARVRCPVLTIHGALDRCQPIERGERVAEITGGEHVRLEGAGHLPWVREPVVVNHLLRDFVLRFKPVEPPPPVRSWIRPLHRERRLLFLSSPIGLGHSRRDIAIADELRRLRPDVQVDWLAQHPLTEMLERRGETVHPASAFLANESSHVESESGEHDLHAFQAIRRMDEILVNNFMVFSDLVEREPYDAWVGDEAWDLDYFLHENPELKRTPYAWLTDFVGWLPMPDGGQAEAALTADYNAEMVEQIERFPRLRDKALFVGNPEDIVPDGLGPQLPGIREWTQEHFEFVGYVTGFDPKRVADTAAVRAELGYGEDEKVCIVTVGGSGVGGDLLRRVIAAYPHAKRLVPELRMVVVAGPRIDPASLPQQPGLEVRGYVHDLYRHLAVCDLAVVQGGLTTTMELTANRRPFLYVPLRHHFEQNFHVRHRLDRYGAGHLVDYDDTEPEALALAMTAELGRVVDYRPVETDGARRAAERILELL
jgi:pimeloyl-ACP methyl ester carboxylesterase/predicted glycosyltransferase